MVELAVAASIYAYKDRLADGFDRGLTESMRQYGPDDVEKTTDFDLMQAKVSTSEWIFGVEQLSNRRMQFLSIEIRYIPA